MELGFLCSLDFIKTLRCADVEMKVTLVIKEANEDIS